MDPRRPNISAATHTPLVPSVYCPKRPARLNPVPIMLYSPLEPFLHRTGSMQAVPPSSFLFRSIVLATLGLLPLGLMAASAQTSRTRPPAPADANRPASPPA